MINWIIGGILAAAAFFAARYVWRKTKNGQCAGCSGNGCCKGSCKKDMSKEKKLL